MHSRPLVATLVFSSLLVASSASATRVAVLAPKMVPPGASEMRDKFHDAIIKGLGKAGDVLAGTAVRQQLASQPQLLNCGGGDCVARAATLLEVDRVIVPEVEDAGKNYTIKLKIFDGTGREIGMGPEEHCEICTVREAVRAVERAGERSIPLVMSDGTAAPAGTKVATSPDEDSPGDHPKFVVTPPVARPAPVPVPVPVVTPSPPAAAVAQPAVAATPPADAQLKDQPSRLPYRSLAIGAFAVALASLAGTITFGYFAGKESSPATADATCSAANPVTGCPLRYHGNVAPAATFGVLTAVAAGTGAVLLYLDWRYPAKHRSTVIGAVPIQGGAAAFASVEF